MPTVKYDVYVNNSLEAVAMSLNMAVIFVQAVFNAYIDPNVTVAIRRREVGEAVKPTEDDFNALMEESE